MLRCKGCYVGCSLIKIEHVLLERKGSQLGILHLGGFHGKITICHMDGICCELIGFQLLSELMNLGFQ